MPRTESPALRLVCPACESKRVSAAPPSRKSGFVVATCKSCGCHWLANPKPAEDTVEFYDDFDRAGYEGFAKIKRYETLDPAYEATLDRISQEIKSGGKDLFDIGAGAGEFLERARNNGFEPHGNELAPGAIELTKEFTGIELHHGDLSSIEGENLYDAVSMWCVIAHVTDSDELLSHILRVLKPGGVLFLQTPRWSAMDTAGIAAARVSRGRWSRVLDRRVNGSHMVLYSKRGLTAQAERVGFEVIEAKPLARYSLKTPAYLGSLGVPARPAKAMGRGLDLAVDRNLFFRNILDLYVRKPLG
jgi:2-polyprenyl-3-methyl-5-hydroxy-6-metoxy-1,4-benzoquinol methylase